MLNSQWYIEGNSIAFAQPAQLIVLCDTNAILSM